MKRAILLRRRVEMNCSMMSLHIANEHRFFEILSINQFATSLFCNT
jgi:hypothetical protein